MKRLNYVFCLLAIVLFAALSAPNRAYAADSGTYTDSATGDVMTWSVDDEGTLTLGGTLTARGYILWEPNDIKKIVIEEGVTEIPLAMFSSSYNKQRYYKKLETVELPSTLKTIGKQAFYNSAELTTIHFPDGLTWIDSTSFEKCKKLTDIGSLPSGLTYIGDSAFLDCYLLSTDIEIPETITYIGEGAFKNCKSITKAVIKKSSYIPEDCFLNCLKLKSVTLPEGLTKICSEAFHTCSELSSINMPSTLQTIGYKGICSTSVTKIKLPEGLTTLGEYALAFNKELKSVTLPESLTEMGNMCFESCTKLTKIKLPSKLTKLNKQIFSGCGLKSVTVPGNIKSVEKFAFDHCSNLKTIIFENGVKTIASQITSNSSLKYVYIPKSVTSIGTYAFGYSSKLYRNAYKLKIFGYSAAKKYAKRTGISYVPAKSVKAKKTSSGISLSWGTKSGATSYKIYRITNYGTPKLLKTIKKAKLRSYKDKTAKKGNTYQYFVHAYKGKKLISSSWVGKVKK